MKKRSAASVEQAYRLAKKVYADLGVDTEGAMALALNQPISLHCWQADDVAGFEVKPGAADGGGIMATGNYPGRARNGKEMRKDLEKVLSLAPGAHRVNVHACYAETGGKPVERDQLEPKHFADWIRWAKRKDLGLDFNTTNFAHPMADDGLTLSHPDPKVRAFWVRHAIACRKIAEHIGRALDNPCVLNHWLPDGMKDIPADRLSPRMRLMDSLDEILSPEQGVDGKWCLDAVESKLFGIGSEAYVVGSFEFYCAYAVSRDVRLCLDMGHFHPTETIDDKISSLLLFLDDLLIHVSRPIRWDSDHVVIFNDDVRSVFQSIVRAQALDRVALAMDFFDASINRIAAYTIGSRATRKALLAALLEPYAQMVQAERKGKFAERLAWMEEAKGLPFNAVWDMMCLRADVPVGMEWMDACERYERTVLRKRG